MSKNVIPKIQIEPKKRKSNIVRVKELNLQYVLNDFSIMIQRSAILKNNINGQHFLQLKLSNLQGQTIQSLYISLILYNDADEIISEDLRAEYIDIKCKVGETFGTKSLIPIPTIIKSFAVKELKVVTESTEIKTYNAEQILYLPDATALKSVIPEQYHQYLDIDKQLVFKPEKLGGEIYRCTCGGLIFDEKSCVNCNRTYNQAVNDTSEVTISFKLNRYIEQQKDIAAAKEREGKINKAILIICILMVLSFLSYISAYKVPAITVAAYVIRYMYIFLFCIPVLQKNTIPYNRLNTWFGTSLFVSKLINCITQIYIINLHKFEIRPLAIAVNYSLLAASIVLIALDFVDRKNRKSESLKQYIFISTSMVVAVINMMVFIKLDLECIMEFLYSIEVILIAVQVCNHLKQKP